MKRFGRGGKSAHDRSSDFDPRRMALEAMGNTLAFATTGRGREGKDLIVPSRHLARELKVAGLEQVAVGSEGTPRVCSDHDVPCSFFRSPYYDLKECTNYRLGDLAFRVAFLGRGPYRVSAYIQANRPAAEKVGGPPFARSSHRFFLTNQDGPFIQRIVVQQGDVAGNVALAKIKEVEGITVEEVLLFPIHIGGQQVEGQPTS